MSGRVWRHCGGVAGGVKSAPPPPPSSSSLPVDSYGVDRRLDLTACHRSFSSHWAQASRLIELHQSCCDRSAVGDEEVHTVISHVQHMMTLLLLNQRQHQQQTCDVTSESDTDAGQQPLVQLFLGGHVLLDLLQWTCAITDQHDSLRRRRQLFFHQLQLYQLLLDSCGGQLLTHEAVLKPLVQLLKLCADSCCDNEAAAGSSQADTNSCEHSLWQLQLVTVLGQICDALAADSQLLSLFLEDTTSTSTSNSTSTGGAPGSFVVFVLLVGHVHNDGVLGRLSRDALYGCAQLSRDHSALASYMVDAAHFCTILATGLGGLFSLLPRQLSTAASSCASVSRPHYRLPCVNTVQLPELHSFISSLDFCDSVLHVCHATVRDKLLELIYCGFLVPVLGPALQQSGDDEAIAITAYCELCLRRISHPGLLKIWLTLLLSSSSSSCNDSPAASSLLHDGDNVASSQSAAAETGAAGVLDTLLSRLGDVSQLCVATLSLFHTVLECNCEDAVLSLLLRHLVTCSHVMMSHRARCCRPPPSSLVNTARLLLSLAPAVTNTPPAVAAGQHERQRCRSEAVRRVVACRVGCASWSHQYDGRCPSPRRARHLVCGAPEHKQLRVKLHRQTDSTNGPVCQHKPAVVTTGDVCEPVDDAGSVGESSGYHSFNQRSSPSPPPLVVAGGHTAPSSSATTTTTAAASTGDAVVVVDNEHDEDATFWSMMQRAESPSAELLAADSLSATCGQLDEVVHQVCSSQAAHCDKRTWLAFDNSPDCAGSPMPTANATDLTHEDCGVGKCQCSSPMPFESCEHTSSSSNELTHMLDPAPTVGVFMTSLLRLLSQSAGSSVQLNIQLLNVISCLAVQPQPLLVSYLFDHSLVFQPSVPSLIQTLTDLKQKLDRATARVTNVAHKMQTVRNWLSVCVDVRQGALSSSPPHTTTTNAASFTPVSRVRGGGLSQRASRLFRSFTRSTSTRHTVSTQSASATVNSVDSERTVTVSHGPALLITTGDRVLDGWTTAERGEVEEREWRLLSLCELLQHWLHLLAEIACQHAISPPSLSSSSSSSQSPPTISQQCDTTV